MSRFVILLGGNLTVTGRLLGQIAGARAIAADGGMAHARALQLAPELWVGDFNSTGIELARAFADVPRLEFPAEKDATDGEIAIEAALRRGASEIVLVGGLGGQIDHALGLLGAALGLARRGIGVLLTSGAEEAWPLRPGSRTIDLAAGSRVSIAPYTDILGLDLTGVKWPLSGRDVALGSSLTLSNIATGPVMVSIREGHGIVVTYPRDAAS